MNERKQAISAQRDTKSIVRHHSCRQRSAAIHSNRSKAISKPKKKQVKERLLADSSSDDLTDPSFIPDLRKDYNLLSCETASQVIMALGLHIGKSVCLINAVIKDITGSTDEADYVSYSKIYRQCEKYATKYLENLTTASRGLDAIGFDGRKDSVRINNAPSEKMEQITVVSYPSGN
ncbi:hypothetical protein Ciccas_012924 [Cichlidogyrus casuarinus]|uniref:Uncharacterized protein n=1 Tax=Cichlidogyrus casuarinus TaxID=1844966 RepID=A0ABD2PNS8_9PLAT